MRTSACRLRIRNSERADWVRMSGNGSSTAISSPSATICDRQTDSTLARRRRTTVVRDGVEQRVDERAAIAYQRRAAAPASPTRQRRDPRAAGSREEGSRRESDCAGRARGECGSGRATAARRSAGRRRRRRADSFVRASSPPAVYRVPRSSRCRVVSSVNVSDSRGMLVTNGPTIQPKPVGIPRDSDTDSQ